VFWYPKHGGLFFIFFIFYQNMGLWNRITHGLKDAWHKTSAWYGRNKGTIKTVGSGLLKIGSLASTLIPGGLAFKAGLAGSLYEMGRLINDKGLGIPKMAMDFLTTGDPFGLNKNTLGGENAQANKKFRQIATDISGKLTTGSNYLNQAQGYLNSAQNISKQPGGIGQYIHHKIAGQLNQRVSSVSSSASAPHEY
jgi:hypothetical protein